MKTKSICLLLSVVLLGCSKQSPVVGHSPDTPVAPTPSATADEFPAHVVRTAEDIEQAEISHQAQSLLSAGDYEGLEALAAKYRTSQESYANGMWKLSYYYDGLEPGRNEAEPAWQAQLKLLRDWNQNKPDSVTARVALGRFWIEYAWKARGGGWANTVTEEGWREMSDRLEKAAQSLREAGRMKERCPVLWSSLLRFALGNEKDRTEYDQMFNQSIAEFPDYEPYYNSRAVFLLPRWYGEDGEWVRDLTTCADRVGGEKGDMIYAQVVWSIHHYGERIDVFDEKAKVKPSWERIDRGFTAILKRSPDSMAAKNERAHLAALAGEREAARKYFAETKGEVDLNSWAAQGEYEEAYHWANAP
jgi:hypothetical protein